MSLTLPRKSPSATCSATHTDQPISTLDSKDMITLTSSDDRHFCVQKDLLTKAKFHSRNVWQDSRELELSEIDSDTVTYFVYWLFHGHVPFAELNMDHEAMDSEPCYPAIRLWIFAERYWLPNLQNIAMGRLYECKAYSAFAPTLINDLYNEIPAGSLLRRFLAREAALTWKAIDLGRFEDLLALALEDFQGRFAEKAPESMEFMVNGWGFKAKCI